MKWIKWMTKLNQDCWFPVWLDLAFLGAIAYVLIHKW